VATITGLPAFAHDSFLNRRNLLGRHLDAEIAARDHHRIGFDEDRVQGLDRSRLLELRHDAGAIADDLSGFDDVGGPLHERQRDPVDAECQAEAQVGAVLLGHRRQRQHDPRHVHALAVRQHAAVDDRRLGKVLARLLDLEAKPAIVEQQFGAGLQRGEDLGVRQRRARRIAGLVAVEIEPEARAFDQLHRTVRERADAQLRTLQVEQHTDRAADVDFDRADEIEPLLVLGIGAVAEVQPEHVGAGTHQGLNRGAVAARGSERGDDLGIAGTFH